MTREKDHSLTERDREILRDIVYSFVLTGEPVSSRAVAKRGRHGLSAASIRNTMADLEERGYLRQPHTSAGRVPTPLGYHFYIDALMRARKVAPKERRYIDAELKERLGDAEDRMVTTSQLLSELSHQVGIVLVPALSETVLKRVDFVPLSGRKVLCVVVSTGGFVDNKVVETEEVIPPQDLLQAGCYLSEEFCGLTLREIRDKLVAMMDHERSQVDRLLSLAIHLARLGLESSATQEVVVDGTAELLAMPELADIERVRRVFEAFSDKVRLVRLLNRCMRGQGVRVLIGDESELTSELDFSLVAASYGMGDRLLGSLGILGPSRMEYDRVIPLVEYLATTLSQALTTTFEG